MVLKTWIQHSQEPRTPIHSALRLYGERACAIERFRLIWAEIKRAGAQTDDESSESKPPQPSVPVNLFLWFSGILERDLNFFLRAIETNIALAALPPPASLAAKERIDELTDLAKRKRYFLSAIFLQAWLGTIHRVADTSAHIRLARTALAIERFRAEHNRLPDNLDELVPELLHAVPADPFDGKPLRYRMLEKGYVVYSVAKDAKDDAGRERPVGSRASKTETYDISFTVER